ncbi:MAG: hypothetical protein WCT32_02175 [Patescibacteria group bacterium]
MGKYYSTVPLDQIPWQRTQADWSRHLVDGGTIKGKTALDLGCGTGKKSIYLAESNVAAEGHWRTCADIRL